MIAGRFCRLIDELDRNHLIVHIASPAHDVAADSWNDTITFWHTNGRNGARTLRHDEQGRIAHLRYMLTFPEYRWMAGSEKSPDQSFVPRANIVPTGINYTWYHRRSVPGWTQPDLSVTEIKPTRNEL